jgi:DNA replication protein DnaC
MASDPTSRTDSIRERLRRLGLWGLLSSLEEIGGEDWLEKILELEEKERKKRSLERRLRHSKIGAFKPICDYEWSFPRKIDREQIEELLELSFLDEKANVILMGPNGVGKTMIAQNIAHLALLKGHTVRRVNASEMLSDLAAQESSAALERRLRRYARPGLLFVDELGYLAFASRQAELFFEVVGRRHQERPTLLTTNRAFSEWNQIFPNASSVTALIDRLVHKAEIVQIDGDSWRAKEAKERAERKTRDRSARRKTLKSKSAS